MANPHASSKPPARETDTREQAAPSRKEPTGHALRRLLERVDKKYSAVATALWAVSLMRKAARKADRPQLGGYNICKIALIFSPALAEDFSGRASQEAESELCFFLFSAQLQLQCIQSNESGRIALVVRGGVAFAAGVCHGNAR